MKITVFGMEIEVVKEKDLIRRKGLSAYYEPFAKKIAVDSELKGEQYIQALIHEIIHAVLHRTGFNQTRISEDLKEMICENVSISIVEIFKVRIK